MYEVIKNLFQRRGIQNISQLDEDEKRDYDRWIKILSEGEVTVESIKKFCYNQIGLIEVKLKDLENTDKKNERLIIQFNIYKSILGAVEVPRKEREALEKYLNSLI